MDGSVGQLKWRLRGLYEYRRHLQIGKKAEIMLQSTTIVSGSRYTMEIRRFQILVTFLAGLYSR